MSKRTFSWSWICLPLIINLFTFMISFLVVYSIYNYHFILTTELGTYNELTLPANIEAKYSILSSQAALLPSIIITVIGFIITFLICWYRDI